MAEFWVKRVGTVLHPADPESDEAFMVLPKGRSLLATIKHPRNAERHHLYWLLCARIAGAIGADKENVSDVLKIATGHYTTVNTKSHGVLKLPKSISWTKMDESSFAKFLDKAINCIFEEWGIEREDVLRVVNEILEPGER